MANFDRDRRSYRLYTSRGYMARERKERDYDYRGERRRERSRSSQRYRYRSPRRSKPSFQSSYSSERSMGTIISHSTPSPIPRSKQKLQSCSSEMTPSPTAGSSSRSSTTMINNNSTTSTVCPVTDMKLFLIKSLSSLGLRNKEAELEVEKILTCLSKVVAQLSGECMRTNQLADLLTGAGYSSGHVAPRLASRLCINFLQSPQGKPGEGETARGPQFPSRVMRVEAGFPRMALGIAYYLHNSCGYEESVSKSLAKSMVEVWIKYDVPYSCLQRVCCEMKMDSGSVRNILKKLLEVKRKKNPRSLDFSSLVDMTVNFFDILSNCE